jgi:hypothetical protein
LREIFSEEDLQKKAAESKFYKRQSEFTPSKFFDLLIFCASHSASMSLSLASTSATEVSGLKITRQSIDKRFNPESVTFVLSILKSILERQLSKIISSDLLPRFRSIRVKDSTVFIVDNRLRTKFKGSGGSPGTSKAAVCIQYEFDVKSGKIIDLNVTSGTRTDFIDAKETMNCVDKDDLIIRDLGYWNLSVLNNFIEQGAFILSRLNATCTVYDAITKKAIDFIALHKYMQKHRLKIIEKDVLVGEKARTPFRLIVNPVTEDVYQKRLRKANKHNKEQGYKTSEDYKARCRFNLFITNTGQKEIPAEKIHLLYRLRWQVELMFKNWKSVCALDKLHAMKYERFVCLLLAKLILIIINLQIIRNLQHHHFKKSHKILSENKCFKTLQNSFIQLRSIWKGNKEKSIENLQKLLDLFSSNHWKESRKNRKNFIELMDLLSCKSNNYGYI